MEAKTQEVKNLISYAKKLKEGGNPKDLHTQYQADIESIQPQDAFRVFFSLIEEGMSASEILVFLDKIINGFYKTLLDYAWEKPKNRHFLDEMYEENALLEAKVEVMKVELKEADLAQRKGKLLASTKELASFDNHYLKKENILFPYMEKGREEFQGTAIMWELHDNIRTKIKETMTLLEDPAATDLDINKAIAGIFFGMLGLKKKEELILFPAASQVLSEEDWAQMYAQSLEYDAAFGLRQGIESEGTAGKEIFADGIFHTETGNLNFNEVLMIFNHLPVDLTFVDENNKVRYFTRPKDRIFPRSPAVIGRDVNNCHPPQSVNVVEEIVASFRSGKEDTAKFWINLKGKCILIRYFALRNGQGDYKGVLEVSEDITEIVELQGERRLLDWNK